MSRKLYVHHQVTKEGKRQFTVWQKRLILRQHVEEGVSVSTLARKYQIHPVTIYNWKRVIDLTGEFKDPHGSVDDLIREIDRLKKENHRLKLSVGELMVDKTCQQEIIEEFKKRHRAQISYRSPQESPNGASQSDEFANSSEGLDKASTKLRSEEGSQVR